MTSGFNFARALAGKSRKSQNPNIVTIANKRFIPLCTLDDVPATCRLLARAGYEKIAATQPNAAETVSEELRGYAGLRARRILYEYSNRS